MQRGLILLSVLTVGCAGTMSGRTIGAPSDGREVSIMGQPVAAPAQLQPKPALVQVLKADGSPGKLVTIQAIDGEERSYFVATNERGEARINVWSRNIPLWRALKPDGSAWIQLVPARIYDADDGAGYRIVLSLVPLHAAGGEQ